MGSVDSDPALFLKVSGFKSCYIFPPALIAGTEYSSFFLFFFFVFGSWGCTLEEENLSARRGTLHYAIHTDVNGIWRKTGKHKKICHLSASTAGGGANHEHTERTKK